MATCPGCGKELDHDFSFCPFCGLTLAAAASGTVERKVVSVFFCDLVGFTAASEATDPEDVRARLRPYHEQLKRELERFGGTVEKFIGDAVMAVFGAPVAHEDDAKRAVRAGLRILEAIEELNAEQPELRLRVRIGISTGEVVADQDAHPERGEGIVTGDVVNTAARLQAAAPVGAIVVAEPTYRRTRRFFEYAQLEPVAAKGKAQPLAIWRPVAERPPAAPLARPFVGRGPELARLREAFERAVRTRAARMVTLVGEPGIGKSRLVLESLPENVRWHRGRCLPYGDGIAFGALGEIVKAHAGVFETDSPEVAVEKLDPVLPQVEGRAWLKARLLPLLGVDSGQPASREESFAAWLRFVESIADDGPAVVVVEDLHWADPALLDFLAHLATSSKGVPLLVLCTARPEILGRHPAWEVASETISLSPLSDSEAAELVGALLAGGSAAHVRDVILGRAGGNPLYAEELVRYIGDTGLDEGRDEASFPDSLHSLIAARLDTIAPDRKSLLQDASVVGDVFWAGALAEMGQRDSGDVEAALDELLRRQFVRARRASSMEGEAEYSFWHVLVRDVAYGQIPRVDRAGRHRAAAAWLEQCAGERLEDVAEALSDHYLQALELYEAAGARDEASEVLSPARRYLVLAGERALGLDSAQAQARLERALDLTPEDDPARRGLILLWADAAFQSGHLPEAARLLETALASFEESGRLEEAAQALMLLSRIARRLGESRQLSLAAQAVALLDKLEPGPTLVDAYTQLAFVQFGLTERACLPTTEQALSLARELGVSVPARALACHGLARVILGDADGLGEAEQALVLLDAQGAGRDTAWLMTELADVRHAIEGLAGLVVGLDEVIAYCRRRGLEEMAAISEVDRLKARILLGHVEDGLEEARRLIADAEGRGDTQARMYAAAIDMELRAARGEADAALVSREWLVETARGSGSIDMLLCALTSVAAAEVQLGAADRARPLLKELAQVPQARDDAYYPTLVPELSRLALACGEPSLAAHFVQQLEPRHPLHEHAIRSARAALAEAAGEHAEAAALYAEAALRWREFGNAVERAHALLGWGRCLVALGGPEASRPLGQANELFVSFGYRPALAETEALLRQVEAAPL